MKKSKIFYTTVLSTAFGIFMSFSVFAVPAIWSCGMYGSEFACAGCDAAGCYYCTGENPCIFPSS